MCDHECREGQAKAVIMANRAGVGQIPVGVVAADANPGSRRAQCCRISSAASAEVCRGASAYKAG